MRAADKDHRLVTLQQTMREVVIFEIQKDILIEPARIEEERSFDHEHAAIDEADATISPDLPDTYGQRHAGKAVDFALLAKPQPTIHRVCARHEDAAIRVAFS